MTNESGKELDQQRAIERELDQLAYRMAQALADLDCPDCCGAVHTFIEHGCEVYREEWEWACFVQVVRFRGGGNRGRG
jgi:hypothetical protein